jgi:hypothetical protein
MTRRNRIWSRPFREDDIAAQFEGFEVEFNDKVTLFPVQVEKNEKLRRKTAKESPRS